VPHQAETDEQLVGPWLFGRSPHTVRAYRREAAGFLAFLEARGRGLATATLGDLQAYADGLAALAPASRQRALELQAWLKRQKMPATAQHADEWRKEGDPIAVRPDDRGLHRHDDGLWHFWWWWD
jgi:hypothetical protein